MSLSGAHKAQGVAGTLRLSVRYLGDVPGASGEPRSQFSWRVESTDPDVIGSYASHHLYAPPGAKVTAENAIRVAASYLSDAGDRFRPGLPLPDVRYPAWLYGMAHRNLAELSVLAAPSAMSGKPLDHLVDGAPVPTPAALMTVEVARSLLRGGENLINAEILDAEDLMELRALTAHASREVVIPDPDDLFAPPLYEGSAADAHTRLTPGLYPAHGRHDAEDLIVVVGQSPLSSGALASAAFAATASNADIRSADRRDLGAASTMDEQPSSNRRLHRQRLQQRLSPPPPRGPEPQNRPNPSL